MLYLRDNFLLLLDQLVKVTCSLLYIALGSGVVQVMWTQVQRIMSLNSTTTSAFPSQPGMYKIWWSYVYMHIHRCAHTHTYLPLSLHVFKNVIFSLQHLSLFSLDVSSPVLQNTKCFKKKYFWLGHIRYLMWLDSIYNMSLRNRDIFPVIWHYRCPIY